MSHSEMTYTLLADCNLQKNTSPATMLADAEVSIYLLSHIRQSNQHGHTATTVHCGPTTYKVINMVTQQLPYTVVPPLIFYEHSGKYGLI